MAKAEYWINEYEHATTGERIFGVRHESRAKLIAHNPIRPIHRRRLGMHHIVGRWHVKAK